MHKEQLVLFWAVQLGLISELDADGILKKLKGTGGISRKAVLEEFIQIDKLQFLLSSASRFIALFGVETIEIYIQNYGKFDLSSSNLGQFDDDGLHDELEEVTGSKFTLFPINDGKYMQPIEYARGGAAKVLVAMDTSIGRKVAVKEILKGDGVDWHGNENAKLVFERFVREGRITGQLEHPSIVPVHEIGVKLNGAPYYTMKLVKGETLTTAIKECSSLDEALLLLPHFRDICNAIAYAHSKNVIHRDIKPDNIMIGAFGETVMLDWGLSKVEGEMDDVKNRIEEEIEQLKSEKTSKTIAGKAIGTPAYMPPEQAIGDIDNIDKSSDIYSLGAVLYQILSGHPPFEGNSAYEIIQKVINKSVPELKKEKNEPPPELAAVAMKAMSKDKSKRYATVKELADEIESYMAGRKVEGYEYNVLELFKRFAQENKVQFIAAILIFFILLASYAFILSAYQVADNSYKRESEARKQALKNERIAHYHFAQSLDQQADKLIGDKRHSEASIYAAASLFHNPSNKLGYYFDQEFSKKFPESTKFKATAESKLYAMDFKKRITFNRKFKVSEIYHVSYSNNNKYLAASGHNGVVQVWNSLDYRLLWKKRFHTDSVYVVQFSHDSKYLLSAGVDKKILLWDVASGTVLKEFLGHKDHVQAVAFSPDGKKFVSVSKDLTMKIWDIQSGRLVSDKKAHLNSIISVVWVNGSLFTGSADHHIKEWDDKSLSIKGAFKGHTDSVFDLAVTSDKKLLISSSSDKTIRVWNIQTKKQIKTLENHTGNVYGIDLSKDDAYIASVGWDGLLCYWDLKSGELITSIKGHSEIVHGVAFSKDGKHIATGAFDKQLKIWNIVQQKQEELYMGHTDYINNIALSSNAKLLATTSSDKTVRLWNAVTNKIITVFRGHESSVWGIDFSPDNKNLISAGYDKKILIWDITSKKLLHEIKTNTDRMFSVKYSPDGKHFATSHFDKKIRVWSTKTRTIVKTLKGHEHRVYSIEFSPDGKYLASVSFDKQLKVWSVLDGTEYRRFQSEDWLSGVSFSSNGHQIAVSGKDGKVELWDMKTRRVERVFKGHDSWVNFVEISKNNKYLLSSSDDQTVILWDFKTAEPLLVLKTNEGGLAINFTPDEKKLFIGDSYNVKKYPIDTLSFKADPLKRLKDFEISTGMILDGFILKNR